MTASLPFEYTDLPFQNIYGAVHYLPSHVKTSRALGAVGDHLAEMREKPREEIHPALRKLQAAHMSEPVHEDYVVLRIQDIFDDWTAGAFDGEEALVEMSDTLHAFFPYEIAIKLLNEQIAASCLD